MNMTVSSRSLGDIVAKAWSNDEFKNNLLRDPLGTIRAEGVSLPDGFEFKVFENTDRAFHLVLPPKPAPLDAKYEEITSWCNCPPNKMWNLT